MKSTTAIRRHHWSKEEDEFLYKELESYCKRIKCDIGDKKER